MTTNGGFPPPGEGHPGAFPTPGGPNAGPLGSYGPPPGHTPPPSYAGQQPPPGPAMPSGWEPRAPFAQAQQPGVVPLRPLGLGDIFDGAIKTIRANPQATIGLAFIVEAVFLLPSLLLSAWISRSSLGTFNGSTEAAVALVAVLPSLASGAAGLLLTGFIIFVVSEAVLGRKAGIGQSWQATRGRLVPLIGVNIMTGIILVLSVGLLLIPIALLAGVGAAASGGSSAAAVALAVIGGLLAFLALIWVAVRLSMGGAVVVLERQGVFASIGRSWRLTRGKAFWRIFGITALAAILAAIVSSLVTIPAGLVSGVVGFGTGVGSTGNGALLSTALDHAAQLLAGAVTTPFTAGVACLLYLDQRIRREALDVTLMHAAGQQAGPPSTGR